MDYVQPENISTQKASFHTLAAEERDALNAIREELTVFAAFHGCEQLEIKRAKPAKLKDLFR
jgi:hypothetical protein